MTPADLAAQAVKLLDDSEAEREASYGERALLLAGQALAYACLAVAGEMGCPLPANPLPSYGQPQVPIESRLAEPYLREAAGGDNGQA